MIPKAYIDAWSEYAPWQQNLQVEQDMVIERALIEIFSDPFLNERLVFRGGTALYKIYLKPQARYSEDIDLVQMKSEPIKETIDVVIEIPEKEKATQNGRFNQGGEMEIFSE